MTSLTQTSIDWDFILSTIRDQKCVIILGPEMARTDANISFRNAFADSLHIEENPLVASYYQDEGFYLFTSSPAKTKVYYRLKNFYQNQPLNKTPYEQLARLPLKLILNAGHDRFLSNAMRQLDIPHSFDYFDKSQAREELPPLRTDYPLVYNLLGSLEEEESLVLTHDDLYQLVFSILSRQQLPQGLLSEMLKAHSLIFLGVNFDKWYVQLLLRLLKVNDSGNRHVRYSTNQKFAANTLTIFQEEFKIEFINDQIPSFINELFERCNQQGLLRTESDNTKSISSTLLGLIEADELPMVLEKMKHYFELHDEDLVPEIIGLSSRYSRLHKRIRQNIIAGGDAEVETTKISNALIELVQEIND